MKIAALLTTYNRREKTIKCLDSLKALALPPDIDISIYLTDDASSDGTADAVKLLHQDVIVLNGNGSLFWAGGMRNSWSCAIKDDFDCYLLINDDTVLAETALTALLTGYVDAFAKHALPAICIGSTADTISNKISYGGKKLISQYFLNSKVVYSDVNSMDCDLGNANIMLVPAMVVKKIGILSNEFTHGIADYDYTLRAKKAGFPVLVVPGILGYCTDDHGNNWKGQTVKLTERIKYLKSPKGLAYHEYLGFIRSHFPVYYPYAFLMLWLKTLFPFIWDGLNSKSP